MKHIGREITVGTWQMAWANGESSLLKTITEEQRAKPSFSRATQLRTSALYYSDRHQLFYRIFKGRIMEIPLEDVLDLIDAST